MSSFLGTGSTRFDTQDVAGDTDLLIKTIELGRALASVLRDKSVALMRGHGSVTVGRSVREDWVAVSRPGGVPL
jgi:HCOMODA/2-hydroxy-3-carboxy-muconic semialdehyde decarboxylase